MKRYPWEEFVSRAELLEGATRPAEVTDQLYRWEENGSKVMNHPDDVTRRPGQPKVHYGKVGAANVLLKNPLVRDQLGRDCDIVAVEMEGSGIADASWTAGQQYLIIRGICDYCDDKKNDLWQGYAAVAAAAYARALIGSMSLKSYTTAGSVL